MRFLNRSLGPFLFPSLLWQTGSNSVHLTFDDGPHPIATPQVLDVLCRFNISATFFMTGERALRYPDLARQVATSGHRIGSHSMSHRSLFLRSVVTQEEEIKGGQSAIGGILGSSPTFFRPPFGHFDLTTLQVAERSGQRIIMWDVDSKDYRGENPHTVVHRVAGQSLQGSIVLFHDSDATAGRIGSYLIPTIESLLNLEMAFAPIPS